MKLYYYGFYLIMEIYNYYKVVIMKVAIVHYWLVTMRGGEKVLEAVDKKIGKTTKSEILELCPNISVSSVEKQIAKLVEEGKLTKVSKGRSSFYIINK